MPNWCENDLEISGAYSDVNNCRNEIAPTNEVDFFKIVPIPDILSEICSGGRMINGKKCNEWRKITIRDKVKIVAIPKIELKKLKAKYGVTNLIDWCYLNWGTKWSACDGDLISDWNGTIDGIGRVEFTFNTAWSPPIPIMDALIKRYPKLEFNLRYYEGGMGYEGQYIGSNGKVTCQKYSETYDGERGG